MNRRTLSATLAAILAVFFSGASSAAATIDMTDIWWNQSESGMGYNIVQNSDFLFVTFYAFGPGNKPTWYVAQLSYADNLAWSGDVYFGNGPFFGSPDYDPSKVTRSKVGTASFTAQSVSEGMLNYTISHTLEGMPFTVTKAIPIKRFTLKNENYTGTYVGWTFRKMSGCNQDEFNYTYYDTPLVTIVHNGSRMSVDVGVDGRTYCGYSVKYAQEGKIGNADGTFVCGGGAAYGTVVFSEMEHRRNGFSFRIDGQDWRHKCSMSGTVVGTLPPPN